MRRKFTLPGVNLPKKAENPQKMLESGQSRKLIEGHLRLALAIAARFPGDEDELVSAAFFAVTKAVRRAEAGHMTHDNISGYIAKFVTGELRRVNRGVRPLQFKYELAQTDDELYIGAIEGGKPDTTYDVSEVIREISQDEKDEAIIELRQLGYTGAEIASELELHEGTVSRRIKRIRRAYKELEND